MRHVRVAFCCFGMKRGRSFASAGNEAKTPGTGPGVTPFIYCGRLRVREIRRRLLAALGHDFVGEALAFVEGAHAGALDRADVHEHVARAVARGDETEAFLGIEELNGTCGHLNYPCVIRCAV